MGEGKRTFFGICWWKNITFTHDVDDIRDSKTINGVKHEYVTLDGLIYQEKWGNNALTFSYDNNDKPYVVKYNNITYYYVLNQQGDVIRLLMKMERQKQNILMMHGEMSQKSQATRNWQKRTVYVIGDTIMMRKVDFIIWKPDIMTRRQSDSWTGTAWKMNRICISIVTIIRLIIVMKVEWVRIVVRIDMLKL